MSSQRLGLSSLILLLFFLQVVIGQYTAGFQYPGNNSYNILDTVIVQWNSSLLSSDSSNSSPPNPVLFAWFLDPATDQVEQISQVEVAESGKLEYNLQNYSSGLITRFPASLWFNLFYDTAVVATPNQEGFNGKIFNVYSDGEAVPTTWDLTTSFVNSPTSGAPSPTGAALLTTSNTGISRTSSTATQTSSPTEAPTSQSTNGGGLSSAMVAVIVISVVAILLLAVTVILIFRLAKARDRIRYLEKQLALAQCRSKLSVATSESVLSKGGLDYPGSEDTQTSDDGSGNRSTIRKSGTTQTLSTAWI